MKTASINQETPAPGAPTPSGNRGSEVKSHPIKKGIHNMSIMAPATPKVTPTGESAPLSALRDLLTSGDVEIVHQFGDKWSDELYFVETNVGNHMIHVEVHPREEYTRVPQPFVRSGSAGPRQSHWDYVEKIAAAISADIPGFLNLIPTLDVPFSHSDSDGTKLDDPEAFAEQLARAAAEDLRFVHGVRTNGRAPEGFRPATLEEVIEQMSHSCTFSLTRYLGSGDVMATFEVNTPTKFLSIEFDYANDDRTYEISGVDGLDLQDLLGHLTRVEQFQQIVSLLLSEETTESACDRLAQHVPWEQVEGPGMALSNVRTLAGVSAAAVAAEAGLTERAIEHVEAGTAVISAEDLTDLTRAVFAVVEQSRAAAVQA